MSVHSRLPNDPPASPASEARASLAVAQNTASNMTAERGHREAAVWAQLAVAAAIERLAEVFERIEQADATG